MLVAASALSHTWGLSGFRPGLRSCGFLRLEREADADAVFSALTGGARAGDDGSAVPHDRAPLEVARAPAPQASDFEPWLEFDAAFVVSPLRHRARSSGVARSVAALI